MFTPTTHITGTVESLKLWTYSTHIHKSEYKQVFNNTSAYDITNQLLALCTIIQFIMQTLF